MAEEALKTEDKITPEVKIPPAAPTAPLSTDELVDKIMSKSKGVKQEPPKEPAAETPKEESKEEPPAPSAPTEPTEPTEEEEIGIEGFSDIISELEKEMAAEEPKTESKPTEPEQPKTYTIKDIASRYGVEADTPEELDKAIEEKFSSQSALDEPDYTKPLRDLKSLIDIKDDRLFLSSLMRIQGWSEERANEYLDSLEESGGKGALKREALTSRVSLDQRYDELNSNIEQVKANQAKAKTDWEQGIRDKISKMNKVFGVPIDTKDASQFADDILSRKIDQQMKDPDAYLQAMRLVTNFEAIKRSLIQSGFKKGKEAGQKAERQFWEGKFHNTKLDGVVRDGVIPREEKQDPNDVDQTIDKIMGGAKARISKRNGTVVQPQ